MHLKTFGCLAFSCTLTAHWTKFDTCDHKTVFLGFHNGTKGYLLYDLSFHNFLVTRNSIFYETKFAFHSKPNSSTSSPKPNPSHPTTDLEPLTSIHPPLTPSLTHSPPSTPPPSPYLILIGIADPYSIPTPTPNPLRQPTRITCPPSYLNDYQHNLLQNQTLSNNQSDEHSLHYLHYPQLQKSLFHIHFFAYPSPPLLNLKLTNKLVNLNAGLMPWNLN